MKNIAIETVEDFRTFSETSAPALNTVFHTLPINPSLPRRIVWVALGPFDMPTDRAWSLQGNLRFLAGSTEVANIPLSCGNIDGTAASTGPSGLLYQLVNSSGQPSLRFERQTSHANYKSHLDVPPLELWCIADRALLSLSVVNSFTFTGSTIFISGLRIMSQIT